MEDEKYNMCHFWSNFEIARLDFFRSKPYEDFFRMMDKSGGFWTERVSIHLSAHAVSHYVPNTDYLCSGEMLRFIPSQLVPSLAQQTFTISVILATDILPSNIALPMPLLANCLGRNLSRSRLLTRKRRKRRMIIGRAGTQRRRTVLGVGAGAIQIS
jgi:hypothetical protein